MKNYLTDYQIFFSCIQLHDIDPLFNCSDLDKFLKFKFSISLDHSRRSKIYNDFKLFIQNNNSIELLEYICNLKESLNNIDNTLSILISNNNNNLSPSFSLSNFFPDYESLLNPKCVIIFSLDSKFLKSKDLIYEYHFFNYPSYPSIIKFSNYLYSRGWRLVNNNNLEIYQLSEMMHKLNLKVNL